jgi:cyclic-di-GMP-binding protein
MPLELSVPAERAAPPASLEIRPKQAKAWIESMPLSQSAEAARKILASLGAMNRSKIVYDDRLQLLEIYRAIADVVLDELDAVYAKSPLPMSAKAKDALLLARELTAEFAYGYKILILEKTGKLLGFGAKKNLPLLAYRAIEYLSSEIRTSYKSYTPVPAGAWREVHQLYLHAETEGVANELQGTDTKASIFDLYVESLLVALTDPYRLTQGELDKVVELIRTYRGSVTLGQAKVGTRAEAHFLVPIDLDKPPKPLLTSSDEDAGGPNWRMLDANGIVEKLKSRKTAFETGNVSATTNRGMSPDAMALLAKLMTLWGDPPKRAYRRDPMETNVAICAGIRAITHFVAMEVQVDPRAEAQAISAGLTIPLISIPEDEVTTGMRVNEWEVVNQSAGGLKVRRVGTTNQPITVGEAVGIKFIGRARWSIGVVRWLTLLDDGGMEFGIQFLAPAARSVAVQPTISGGAQVRSGLLLAEGDSFDGADSILTPPNTYADLREFEVEDGGEVSCIRATSLIEKTVRFELFHFSPS